MIEQTLKRMQNHFWLVITVLSIVCFLVILFSDLIPAAFGILQISHEIHDKQKQINQVRDWDDISEKLEGSKEILKKQMEQFIFSQRQDTHLSTIIKFLSQVAESEKVSLTSIKPQEVIQNSSHIVLPIELTLFGEYHQLAGFINRIETSKQIIKIESIQLTSPNLLTNRLNGKLYLLIYYLR